MESSESSSWSSQQSGGESGSSAFALAWEPSSETPPVDAAPQCQCRHKSPANITCQHIPSVQCGGPAKCGFCRYFDSQIAADVQRIESYLKCHPDEIGDVLSFLGIS